MKPTLPPEQQLEEILADMEKHYCRLNGQDDGYLVKKTTMRKILAQAIAQATSEAEDLMSKNYEEIIIPKRLADQREQIAKELMKPTF